MRSSAGDSKNHAEELASRLEDVDVDIDVDADMCVSMDVDVGRMESVSSSERERRMVNEDLAKSRENSSELKGSVAKEVSVVAVDSPRVVLTKRVEVVSSPIQQKRGSVVLTRKVELISNKLVLKQNKKKRKLSKIQRLAVERGQTNAKVAQWRRQQSEDLKDAQAWGPVSVDTTPVSSGLPASVASEVVEIEERDQWVRAEGAELEVRSPKIKIVEDTEDFVVRDGEGKEVGRMVAGRWAPAQTVENLRGSGDQGRDWDQ